MRPPEPEIAMTFRVQSRVFTGVIVMRAGRDVSAVQVCRVERDSPVRRNARRILPLDVLELQVARELARGWSSVPMRPMRMSA